MLIFYYWFHAVFTRQSSVEKEIFWRNRKVEKYSHKNVFVKIAYNFECVCVCVCVCVF